AILARAPAAHRTGLTPHGFDETSRTGDHETTRLPFARSGEDDVAVHRLELELPGDVEPQGSFAGLRRLGEHRILDQELLTRRIEEPATVDVVGVMHAGGQIELAVIGAEAVAQCAAVRLPAPALLITTVHHQGVVRHR